MRFAINLLLPVALGLGAHAFAAGADRAEFRSLLQGLSEKSQAGPLICNEALRTGAWTEVQYKFRMTNDPAYRDAFNMLFTNLTDGRQWSTLVAYEGYRGFVMGELKVERIGNEAVYAHAFHGYYEDVTTVHTIDGMATSLRYKKVNRGTVAYELICAIP